MKALLSFLVFCLFSLFSFGQGKLNGKVVDSNGEPMYGVIVRAQENEKIISQTDFDGLFTLVFPDNKEYSIRCYMVGYDELIEPFSVKDNEVVSKDFVIIETGVLKDGVEIIAKAKRSSDSYMERIKINSAATLDYISSETFKKTGDSNVIGAIARVSGVSTSGGLITVRGIGDRYVRTTLNGARIPTLDPLTNNIKLDIFPASLVDNIVITKTQTPEYPGDWAGAYISVETKDYPDKLSVNVETQFGYNAQSTFQDFITSERSSTDWLGFDNGTRKRETSALTTPILTPSTYQEMVALGLEGFYNEQGISGWTDGNSQAESYFKLGLVELGLLSPGLINDQAAYQNARANYLSEYKPLAFSRLNPNGTDHNNGFSNSWNTRNIKAPINFSQSFSLGNQTTLFGKELGFLVGFRYGNVYRYDPDGVSQRVGDETLGYPFDRQDHAQLSRETNSWSALMNIAYKLNENNKVSVLFMPNVIGINDVARYESFRLPEEFQEKDIERNIFYEERRQLIGQFSSSHFIPKWRLKIDFNNSFTGGKSVAPDFKATQYIQVVQNDSIVDYVFSPTAGDGIRRYYRYLTENILDSRLGFEMPLNPEGSKRTRKLKFGFATQRNYRKSDNEEYRVLPGNNTQIDQLVNDDLDAYMRPSRFIVQNGIQDFVYSSFDNARNHSFGNANVEAGYVMLDYEFIPSLRFAGGVRVEHTDIFTDVDQYYLLGLENNDPRRENVGGFPFVNAANLDQWDVLPSASLVFKRESEKGHQTNVRLNYSQSLARPSIRELSDAAIFDNEFRTLIYGNSELKVVNIDNYDVRFEKYFLKGDHISVSVFYKSFKNHIEMGFGNSGITWENVASSNVRGVELEGKKKIGSRIELQANVTVVNSLARFIRRDLQTIDGIKVYSVIDTVNRPMFGQAPYLINGILNYQADSSKTILTLSYNVQGPRLVIAGAVRGRADVYELPRHTLDFKASRQLGKHFTVSLTIRDILNAPVRRSYDLPEGWVDYDSFRYGTNFQLGFAYKL